MSLFCKLFLVNIGFYVSQSFSKDWHPFQSFSCGPFGGPACFGLFMSLCLLLGVSVDVLLL